MKTFWETVIILSVFLALSGITYADDNNDSGLEFKARLTAAQEVPENSSDATGDVEVEFDKGFTKLEFELRIRNTTGTITNAHFHCALPGENGPVAFGIFAPGPLPVPVDAQNVEVKGVLTNADFNNVDCVPTIGRAVNNLAALAFAMRDGLIYANVHTTFQRAGELRGQMIEIDKVDDLLRLLR